jgi:acyl-CoA synthetase (AMP-forming)/AMP-acid ligase II
MPATRLLEWLEDPSTNRGIYFARPGDGWDLWSYARLAELTRRVAQGLTEAGIREEEVVCLALRSGPEFVATYFGTILAGGIPAPISPLSLLQDPLAYRAYLTDMLVQSRAALLVIHRYPPVDPVAGTFDTKVLRFDDIVAEASDLKNRHTGGSELAMLQFTSGSSGSRRAIKVPFSALETNIEAIRRWLQWTPEDSFASWLPLHHDMGLVGAFLCSVVGGTNLWLLQTEHFVRSPVRYLRCFGATGAQLTVTPNFALDYISRKVRPEDLEGLDLSFWRGMVIGAERIDVRSLEAFCQLLAPFGFRRSVPLPAYGLAEATLAVTGLPIGEQWAAETVVASSLQMGSTVVNRAHTRELPNDTVVGCGRQLDHVSVSIMNEGRTLPDGTIGEIVVAGGSVTAGYLEALDSPSSTTFADGRLHTGDAGFLIAGQLFVLGRLGDGIKVHGRMVFAEDLEIALGAIGIPRRRVVVLLGFYEGRPTAVILCERLLRSLTKRVGEVLRSRIADATLLVLDAPKDTIVRTSSGKPKRRLLWSQFTAGVFAGFPLMLETSCSSQLSAVSTGD